MCSPVALMGASAAGSALFGAVSAYRSTAANRTAAEYQAAVDRNNAQLAEWERQDALRRGEQASALAEIDTARRAALQQATLAANGVVTTEGSALRLLGDTEIEGELRRREIREGASDEAWRAGVERDNLLTSSAFNSRASRRNDPMASVATSLLGSATSYYGTRSAMTSSRYPRTGWSTVASWS